MRFAVVALPLVALAACGGGDRGRPADGDPSDLVAAAARGDVASVRRLLAGGAYADARDRDGRTAVTAAAIGDHVDVARVLIDAGADVDLQDAERNNPLLVCGRTGSCRSSPLARPPPTRRATCWAISSCIANTSAIVRSNRSDQC